MAIAKVILNGETLMDVTSDTVEANKLLSGETATKNNGTKVMGTYVAPDPVISALTVAPTESQQTFNSAAVSGYKPVTVGAIASDYVGSAIPMRSANDIVYNEYEPGLVIPSGYYSSKNTVSGVTMRMPTITSTIESSGRYLTVAASYSWNSGYLSEASYKDNVKTIAYGISFYTNSITYSITNISSAAGNTALIGISATFSKLENYAYFLTKDTIINSSFYAPYKVVEGRTVTPTSETQLILDANTITTGSIYVAGGGGSGDGYTVDQIAMKTISGAISGEAMTIKSYAFNACSALTEARFLSCTLIENSAFSDCYALSSISFPVCTRIGQGAFDHCSALTEASFPLCTSIGATAFCRCSALSSISFPECISIGNAAFQSCYSLTKANFSKCGRIYFSAFTSCSALTEASFPLCTSIGNSVFYSCRALSSISFPVCTSIGASAFYGCSALTEASFPLCTSIGANAFFACHALNSISFPVCTILSSSTFAFCYALTSINFPSCINIGNGAFYGCSALTEASFPLCTSIGASAFTACHNLLSLYLLGSSLANLITTAAFTNTPISNYTTSTGGVYGSVFVPASLYDSYISATNWSVYSDRIVGLTDEEIAALG